MSVLRFDCRFHYPAGFSLEFAFEADSGVTALVGPSGCGKTTVLNLIAGLLRPDEGQIVLAEQELFSSTSGTNLPPERRQVGFVFQDYQLFPHLTVAQNLRYGERRSRSVRFSFAKTVEILGLGGYLDRHPVSLSGGQRQRVAIGRAVLRGANLLLLDEPFSALDAELRQDVSGYLGQVIAEFQIPTLLVSHHPESVSGLASSTVRLS
ncbi:MAG TPA: ATP-binding cassette domain-containing protein [Pirellulaceae bacterium]|nr:ATP-binding cassette domain-containing protein [Pirellulaceae bacterium]